MNKSRRIRIERIAEKIDDLLAAVEELRLEEEEAYDNLPESIQDSDRGQAMADAVENLESAYTSLEEAEDYLNYAIE